MRSPLSLAHSRQPMRKRLKIPISCSDKRIFLETTGEYPWNESQDFSVLAMGSLASMVLDSRC